jgi:tagaturonate reductase
MKMAMRNLATIERYYKKFGKSPDLIAKGFAAFLLFSRPIEKNEDHVWVGEWNGKKYPVQDDKAELLHNLWKNGAPIDRISIIMESKDLWGEFKFPDGFKELVVKEARQLLAG